MIVFHDPFIVLVSLFPFYKPVRMLRLLLEVDGALGDSHPFGHNGDDLHGLPFQDRTCGAPLGYVPVSRRELTFFFTPVHFLGRLLYFNYCRPRRCLTARPPLPQRTRFASPMDPVRFPLPPPALSSVSGPPCPCDSLCPDELLFLVLTESGSAGPV